MSLQDICNNINAQIDGKMVTSRTQKPLYITDPANFNLFDCLRARGYTDNVLLTDAIKALDAKLHAELQRISQMEQNMLAKMRTVLNRLEALLPAVIPQIEQYLARNQAKYANSRNHTRQQAFHQGIGLLGPPIRKKRPSNEQKQVVDHFLSTQNRSPTVDERIFLACLSYLDFKQISYLFAVKRHDDEDPSSPPASPVQQRRVRPKMVSSPTDSSSPVPSSLSHDDALLSDDGEMFISLLNAELSGGSSEIDDFLNSSWAVPDEPTNLFEAMGPDAFVVNPLTGHMEELSDNDLLMDEDLAQQLGIHDIFFSGQV